MKILITGGGGNLALQLLPYLPPEAEITLLDIADCPGGELPGNTRYLRGDLTDRASVAAVFREVKPDQVIHMGSLLSASTERDRRRGWAINATASLEVLEQCLEHGVDRVFFPSSLATWGGPLPDRIAEDQPQWPDGLYGVTKVAVERLGNYYYQRHGLDFRSLRLVITISPLAPDGAASSYASHCFSRAMKGQPYRFKVRPTTRASIMYVKDALRAMAELLAADSGGLTRRVYNIHALSPSADELKAAIEARCPDADISYETDPIVANLIESWPAQIGDDSARLDWGWKPLWDLDAIADDLLGPAC